MDSDIEDIGSPKEHYEVVREIPHKEDSTPTYKEYVVERVDRTTSDFLNILSQCAVLI